MERERTGCLHQCMFMVACALGSLLDEFICNKHGAWKHTDRMAAAVTGFPNGAVADISKRSWTFLLL